MPASAVPDRVPVRELHAMVGLGRHASTSELRYAYERAMADAVGRGDHKHAVALSAAYDALSGVRRSQIYGSRPDVSSPLSAGTRNSIGEQRWRSTAARASGPSTRRRAGLSRRIGLYLLLIPTVVALGVTYMIHKQPAAVSGPVLVPHPITRMAPTQFVASAGTAPASPSVTSARTYTPPAAPSGSRYIPADTPVNSQGYVTVICQTYPGGPGYVGLVRRGESVWCLNGAIPMIEVGAR